MWDLFRFFSNLNAVAENFLGDMLSFGICQTMITCLVVIFLDGMMNIYKCHEIYCTVEIYFFYHCVILMCLRSMNLDGYSISL